MEHSESTDNNNKEMFHKTLNFVKLYLLLVLLPQVIWMLSNNSSGFFAVCESCGQGEDVRTFIRLFTQKKNVSSPSQKTCNPDQQSTIESSVDHSSCTKQLQTDPNQDSAYSSDDQRYSHTSELKRSHKDDVAWDYSELCTCEVEALTREVYNDSDLNGGWRIPHNLPDWSGPCNIKRVDGSLSQSEFVARFAYSEPVILTGVSDQSAFRAQSTKYRLLKDYGHDIITVATANTHSYRKERVTLCDYVEKMMKAQSMDSLGNETLYYFGDNNRDGWSSLFSLYQLPPYKVPGTSPVLSFGMAGPGTGVPFHIHGPRFAETVYGRKRWFLYPPSHTPLFHPDETTHHWVTQTYPQLVSNEKERPLECTLKPGEVIYFPDKWWHATLNLDTAVFMSTFYS